MVRGVRHRPEDVRVGRPLRHDPSLVAENFEGPEDVGDGQEGRIPYAFTRSVDEGVAVFDRGVRCSAERRSLGVAS